MQGEKVVTYLKALTYNLAGGIFSIRFKRYVVLIKHHSMKTYGDMEV
jgi:hypothetical protein